jgi:hypothetical protein
LVRIIGYVACTGIFDRCFNLIKKEFDGLGWMEGCAHFGIVVLDVAGRDDSVGCVEVSQNLHGGDVTVACVPIAQTSDVGFVEGVNELLLKSFAGGVVFAPDAKVFFVLSDGLVDLRGCAAGFKVGCCPGVVGSITVNVS